MLKEALDFLVNLGEKNGKTEVLEICGKTYSTRELVRYDQAPKARPMEARSLRALTDYIEKCSQEFRGPMVVHVESPKKVRLVSSLDGDRARETLFVSDADVSDFWFDQWYDQERFIINLQASFAPTPDLEAIQKVAGNIEAKTTANYGDDGISQKTTINSGIASKEDVIVPNPCILTPYRTFQEVEQPSSLFVFRISDNNGAPSFKLVEADNSIWKCEAVQNIKDYILRALAEMPPEVAEMVTVIG